MAPHSVPLHSIITASFVVALGTAQLNAQALPEWPALPHKSAATAFALSLAGTAVPLIIERGKAHPDAGVIAIAILAGPAIGHLYAGQGERASAGLAIRGAILGFTALGAAGGGCANGPWICIPPAVIAGVIAEGVAMIVDIVAAPSSARKWNRGQVEAFLTPLPGREHTRVGVGLKMAIRM